MSKIVDLEEYRLIRILAEDSKRDKELEKEALSLFDKYVSSKIQIQMIGFGFVTDKFLSPCTSVEEPHITYEDYVESDYDFELEDHVQCPFYGETNDICGLFEEMFKGNEEDFRPCRLLYRKLKKHLKEE